MPIQRVASAVVCMWWAIGVLSGALLGEPERLDPVSGVALLAVLTLTAVVVATTAARSAWVVRTVRRPAAGASARVEAPTPYWCVVGLASGLQARGCSPSSCSS